MRDDNGLTIPGTEGDTWEDDEHEHIPEKVTYQDDPNVYYRCQICKEMLYELR